MLAVNGRGTFLCYKHAAQEMIARGTKGRIIGASSIAGKRGSCESFNFLRLLVIVTTPSTQEAS